MIGLVCILPIMEGIELAGWKTWMKKWSNGYFLGGNRHNFDTSSALGNKFNALVGWWKLFLYFCGNLGCFHIDSDQYTPEHKNSF